MSRKSIALYEPKQNAFERYYLDPMSSTYGNSAASARKAGYAESYATSLIALKPKWFIQMRERVLPDEIDIINGIKRETHYGLRDGEKDTAMAAQTRLKAYELIGKTRKVDAFADGRQANHYSGDIHITLGNPDKPLPANSQVIDID